MKKDKPNKSSHCLIERAVEKLLNDEKQEQQVSKQKSNVIRLDSRRSRKIVSPLDFNKKKAK